MAESAAASEEVQAAEQQEREGRALLTRLDAALKAGAFDYLAKPVSLEQLRSLVKSALSLPAVVQQKSGGGEQGQCHEVAEDALGDRGQGQEVGSRVEVPANVV